MCPLIAKKTPWTEFDMDSKNVHRWDIDWFINLSAKCCGNKAEKSIVNQAQTEITIVHLHVVINIHPRFVVNDFRFCQRIIWVLKISVTAVAMLQIYKFRFNLAVLLLYNCMEIFDTKS